MPDPIPTRENLDNSDYRPVDPAFRGAYEEDNKAADITPGPATPPVSRPTRPPQELSDRNPFSLPDQPNNLTGNQPESGFGMSGEGISESMIKKIVIVIAVVAATALIATGVIALMKKGGTTPPQPEDPLVNIPANTPSHIHLALQVGQSPLDAAKESFSKITQPVTEVTFYNKDARKLSREEFAEQSGLTVPGYVADTLSSDYYFFLTKSENGVPKAILLLQSKAADGKGEAAILKRWEAYLQKDLKDFILLGENYDYVTNANFSAYSDSGKYPGGRYLNFLRDGSVSLNYLVMRDKILIANSFEAFEAGIENVKTRSDL